MTMPTSVPSAMFSYTMNSAASSAKAGATLAAGRSEMIALSSASVTVIFTMMVSYAPDGSVRHQGHHVVLGVLRQGLVVQLHGRA